MRQFVTYFLRFWIVASLLLAGVVVIQYINSLPGPGDRLVEGGIIKREVEKTFVNDRFYYGYLYSTLLTIKIVDSDTVVTTRLDGDWANNIPDAVTFYYSGDPTREVYLQQDKSLLSILVGFLIVASVMLLVLTLLVMLQKREQRYQHDQYEALLEEIK